MTAPVIQTTWKPSRRNIIIHEKPDWVPQEIYDTAKAAKTQYNADWEFWVWGVSQQYNVSQAVAEDACIRGLQKEIYKIQIAYTTMYGADFGVRLGKWFEEFLDMSSIFSKVKMPEFVPELGYRLGSMSIEVKQNERRESESSPE